MLTVNRSLDSEGSRRTDAGLYVTGWLHPAVSMSGAEAVQGSKVAQFISKSQIFMQF